MLGAAAEAAAANIEINRPKIRALMLRAGEHL
jgi:hypothetical protein